MSSALTCSDAGPLAECKRLLGLVTRIAWRSYALRSIETGALWPAAICQLTPTRHREARLSKQRGKASLPIGERRYIEPGGSIGTNPVTRADVVFGTRTHRGITNARPLHPLPDPIADPTDIAQFRVRRRDRLGGLLHEYEHAA
jgi:hypothetical protein